MRSLGHYMMFITPYWSQYRIAINQRQETTRVKKLTAYQDSLHTIVQSTHKCLRLAICSCSSPPNRIPICHEDSKSPSNRSANVRNLQEIACAPLDLLDHSPTIHLVVFRACSWMESLSKSVV
ncbi:hypothetical protein P153DRAFT_146898 [Dothidotthia symphoricarpi CBS 119687]|uniref:Uncharacterized protein n=1 Tax=Dothidotthia symphoricarpi CBS 119687 TaxID=1392245 RepID=A0A6A5ZXQ6_9PLEO|nr:uncharacterized protein P153DRAFT_146898 [Dothidotthia symphoricarpi CBS 119687]KAF2123805.1 hypothetical protein P153DRAFT_146898 [Dothidotthia symphoricarpi CBS 119687]